MFNLIFGGFAAMHQIGALLAALVCAGLGGLMVGHAVYWRLHAIRVLGQVIGVRQGGPCFNAVYRYTLPCGQTHEATSIEGSSSMDGKATGTAVPLLVIPNKPDQVEEARSHVFTAIGMALLATGAGLFYIAVTKWPVGPITVILGCVLIARFAFFAHRIILPKEKRLPSTGRFGMFARHAAADGVVTAPVLRIEDIAALPENRALAEAQRASNRRAAPILLIVGLAFLVLGVYSGEKMLRLEASGIRATGSVRSLEIANSGSSGMVLHPIVEFSTAEGTRIRFRDNTGSNPSLHHAGDVVRVLYLPESPQHAVIDQGWGNGFPSIGVFLLGSLCIFLSARIFRQLRFYRGV